MNVHVLSEEGSLPEFNGKTLTAFTWTFGTNVPLLRGGALRYRLR